MEDSGMKIVGVGYAELVSGGDDDDDDDNDDKAEETGRMSFGGFHRKTEVCLGYYFWFFCHL